MRAEGLWTFWNQYATVPFRMCVERAKQLQKGVIVKGGYWAQFDAFKAAGVPVAVERYVYPSRSVWEAQQLSEGINRGAQFAVINAEVQWEAAGVDGGVAMLALIQEFQRLQPGVEIYASVDTRGGRTHMPYQQVLGAHCTAWMPMIYPLTFYPGRTGDWVARAFHGSLDTGQDFQGKPVLPTIQTYHNIGALAVEQQLREVRELRQQQGCQAYTVGHATSAEWEVFTRGGGSMAPTNEELEKQIQEINLRLNLTGKVFQWAGLGLSGDPLPDDLRDTLHFLLHLAGAGDD